MARTRRSIPVNVLDSEYRYSHGAAPRGRGAWLFSTERNPTTDQIWTAKDVAGFASLTYGQAKREARRHYGKIAREAYAAAPDVAIPSFDVYVMP